MNSEKNTTPQSVISDTLTLEALRNFLSSPKPPSIGPVDVLHVVLLMLRKAQDHPIYDSQQTLARMFGCEVKTVARSQQLLASPRIDWLSRPQRPGRTRALMLCWQNLPGKDPLHLHISQDAGTLAFQYQGALRRLGRKRFQKQWLAQQLPSAQRIINECDGDLVLAASMIGHALNHPRHSAKARQSLYNLYGRWKQVERTYSLQLQRNLTAEQRAEQKAAIEKEQGELDSQLSMMEAEDSDV